MISKPRLPAFDDVGAGWERGGEEVVSVEAGDEVVASPVPDGAVPDGDSVCDVDTWFDADALIPVACGLVIGEFAESDELQAAIARLDAQSVAAAMERTRDADVFMTLISSAVVSPHDDR